MIKGSNKRVIVMKDTGHDMIEEAFFILKANSPSCKEKCYSEDDILKQANLILDEKGCGYPFGDVKYNVSALPRKKSRIVPFLLGAMSGICATCLLAFFL